VLPSALRPDAPRTGTFFVQNVYESMHPLESNSVKYLRVNALFNQATPRVPQRSWAENEVPKGVLGTVPVSADGSAAFHVPSRTPLQLQLLDADKMCVMNMRSFVFLQDGERVSCTGCHEDR
jgi:NADH:ubiquinone oxidoreductase subunit D